LGRKGKTHGAIRGNHNGCKKHKPSETLEPSSNKKRFKKKERLQGKKGLTFFWKKGDGRGKNYNAWLSGKRDMAN